MFHYLHCIVLHSRFLKEISSNFSSIYSSGCDFMMALSQLESVSSKLGHAFLILLFCHLYYAFWCSMNWFSKLICLKTSPKIRKSDRFLTGLVSWFIHIIRALAQDWWWEHVAGDNQEKRDMNLSDSASLPFACFQQELGPSICLISIRRTAFILLALSDHLS